MAFDGLQSYLSALEQQGELRPIGVEVDPELEITEIADRVLRAGGPALRFDRPRRSAYPVAINLFGTLERTAFALGVSHPDGGMLSVLRLLAATAGHGSVPGCRGAPRTWTE